MPRKVVFIFDKLSMEDEDWCELRNKWSLVMGFGKDSFQIDTREAYTVDKLIKFSWPREGTPEPNDETPFGFLEISIDEAALHRLPDLIEDFFSKIGYDELEIDVEQNEAHIEKG